MKGARANGKCVGAEGIDGERKGRDERMKGVSEGEGWKMKAKWDTKDD